MWVVAGGELIVGHLNMAVHFNLLDDGCGMFCPEDAKQSSGTHVLSFASN
jgi:hypothetical protein